MSNTFTWKTKFKSIIVVDSELFSNEYKIEISLSTHTANLKEQTAYFERLKNLFEQVIVTNSIPVEIKDGFPQLKVLSVANMLGEAIWRIHEESSVSSMFR